jgi:hypothetical protein
MQYKKGKLLTTSIVILLVLVIFPFSTSSLSVTGVSDKCYGVIIPVNKYQSNELQMEISKLVNELLKNNIEVYWLTNHIFVKSKSLDKNSSLEAYYFEKGSFVVPFLENLSKNNEMSSIVYRYNNNSIVKSFILMEPISNIQVYKLNSPKIAYHNGPWMMNHLYFTHLVNGGFETYEFLTWNEIPKKLNNEDFNVFIWGASITLPQTVFFTVSDHFKYHKAISKVREFVRNGGSYVGSCLASVEISLGSRLPFNKFKPFFPKIPSFFTLSFSECKGIKAQPGGTTTISVEIVDNDSPIAYGLPKVLKSHLAGGVVYLNSDGNTKTVGIFKDIEEPTMSSKIYRLIRDLWMKHTIGKPIWVTTDFGKGKVVSFGDHPEFLQCNNTSPFSYSQIGNHSRIVYNAIFYASSEGPINIDINQDISCNDLVLDDNRTEDITDQNNPPNKPDFYLFMSKGKVKPYGIFFLIAQTDDPDGDLFYYKIYYDDNSPWDNYTVKHYIFTSGQNLAFYHSYNKTGKYFMKVQAIDIHRAESEWSDPLEIIVTKTPFISRIFNK